MASLRQPLAAGQRRLSLTWLLLGCVAAALAGCGTGGTSAGGSPSGRLAVVAAENFWGSLARQLGGDRVSVSSIIVNPNTDPHSYEPNASDAIALARSRLAIVNGIGYDDWASKLLAATPDSSRVVLDVGEVLGLRTGDNPHVWYSPSAVATVIGRIVAEYKRLDPGGRAYYDRRQVLLQQRGLARYDQLRSDIRSRFAGVPVGYSESIFQPLGQDLGLRLLTPYSFARAVAEGSDVTAADKQAVDAQIRQRQIKVWIFNSQNVTPDVRQINQLAREVGIPVTTVTETLTPASATFEQWQADELGRLLSALQTATGRR